VCSAHSLVWEKSVLITLIVCAVYMSIVVAKYKVGKAVVYLWETCKEGMKAHKPDTDFNHLYAVHAIYTLQLKIVSGL